MTAELRRALNRRDLAATAHRSAVRKRLVPPLDESGMLVVAHLAEHGAMRPADLMRRLALSSGGITAVIYRLEADGWVTRRRHPSDGRAILLTLNAEHVEQAADLYAPLTTALDVLAAEFTPEQLSASIALLERAADITARHAARLGQSPRPARSGIKPALWG